MPYTLDSLAEIIAQIVDFSWDDYNPIIPENVYPDNVGWNIAYVCACFLAQHTVEGHNGVDTEYAYNGLSVDSFMSYKERLKLAKKIINQMGGPK